ncbi:MAG: cell division protein FtsL [Clostridiales bacterium]|nr:cell division protein FtsL [Clostridiales bacterium]MDD6390677.1 cell division protein FtsL [Bacillota bacterium]MDY5975058.1 cell division protein FtsL [Anaerovoracaceae bacterium]
MQEAQWYDFEEAYRQHGHAPGQSSKSAASSELRHSRSKTSFTARDKKIALMLVVVIGLAGILSIVSAAFSATLKYQVNTLVRENQMLENEIADTDIKLQTANSITNLEKKAKKKLGMKYPSSSQIVYVNDIETPGDLASVVSDQADN